MFRTIYCFLIGLCFFVPLMGAEIEKPAIETYLQLLHDYPQTVGPFGHWQEGEIEIIRDANAIQQIQATTGRLVGIVAQDKYWIWLNDAVRFPNGKSGVYGRLLWRQSLQGPTGVAVMCLLPNGKIALNCNYRHATRAWELELPRGGAEPGETALETARREVLEETGMVIDQLIFLGEMSGDTGVTNSVVPIFLATVKNQEKATPEDSEAIEEIIAFSLSELLNAIKAGKIEIPLRGIKKSVKVRDPFLTYALLQAQLQGYLQ